MHATHFYQLNFDGANEQFNAIDQGDFFNFCPNGLEVQEIEPVESFPLPWDVGVSVAGQDLLLSGGAGPSGWGQAQVRFPLKDASRTLMFSMACEGPMPEGIRQQLELAGVLIQETETK